MPRAVQDSGHISSTRHFAQVSPSTPHIFLAHVQCSVCKLQQIQQSYKTAAEPVLVHHVSVDDQIYFLFGDRS